MSITAPAAPTPVLPGILRYQVLAGSHAYGLAGPGSDADWRGIFQLPTEAFLGVHLPGKHGAPETAELPPDQVYYELRHFAALVLGGNPNIMEMLWLPDRLVAVSSPVAERLRAVRSRYLTRKMIAAYLGWAKSERMQLAPAGREMRPELGGKRGSHVVRLLWSLNHALDHGELVVTMEGPERELALAIKRGELRPAEALAHIERLEAKAKATAERLNWPDPDPAPLNEILLAARRGEL